MASNLSIPIIDLSSPDRFLTAKKIRQACDEYDCFYVVNHGVEKELIEQLFDESKNFFTLPAEEKMKCARTEQTGYTPIFAEKLDPTAPIKGDQKEIFLIGPLSDDVPTVSSNIWPSKDVLANWRPTMETLYQKLYDVGKEVVYLLALALNLDEDSYEKIEAISKPISFLRLLRYPGEKSTKEKMYGSSPHTDPGMLSLVLSDGTPGLQICRDKFKEPHVYEDVPHVEGGFYVNVGDMMERLSNRLYQSTLHRVVTPVKERYSVVYFLEPPPEYEVECMESCCSEEAPARYGPMTMATYIRDYLKARGGIKPGSELNNIIRKVQEI